MCKRNGHMPLSDDRTVDEATANDSPGAAAVPSLMPLVLVGLSGVLFSVQGGVLKLSYAHGAGAFEVVMVRGLIQSIGVFTTQVALHQRGAYPLPVRHWLGTSWRGRNLPHVFPHVF